MQAQAKKIVVLGTGGTIAGASQQAGDNVNYSAAQRTVQDLLGGISHLSNLPFAVHSEQLAQVDSKDMTTEIWANLARRVGELVDDSSVQGVVVTHGTDTMEETAYLLHAALRPKRPVVLTGAMRPATAISPDGPQNLLDALAVVVDSAASGVSVVMAGAIHGAIDVFKAHNYRVDAFSSGDRGPLGYVEEGRLRMVRSWPIPAALAAEGGIRRHLPAVKWPRVEIVTSHAGAGGTIVPALLAFGVDGLVVAGTGNGTVHSALSADLKNAQAKGVRVVRSSRCLNGSVLATELDEFPHSDALTPVKARVALMLELLARD